MKSWIAAISLLLVTSLALGIDAERAFDDPVMQQRYEDLTQELRCLVCQNQTIADSNATLAQDLRREVRELMGEGKSDAEIRDFLTARYGDFVLYLPPVAPRTWLLWAAPLLLVLGGMAFAAFVVRKRMLAARAHPEWLDEEGDA